MPLNISEIASVRDRVGTARRANAALALACGLGAALVLSSAGCQLVMDDLPHRSADADVGDGADGDSGADGGENEADAGDLKDGSVLDARNDRDAVGAESGVEDTGGDADAADPPEDAATPTPDADSSAPDPAACDGAGEKTFYRDGDHDGYGDPTMTLNGCDAPSDYVDRAGDCHDGNPDVHDGQTAFFGVGYTGPGLSIPSFDYDCDGEETSGPEQRLQACSSGLLACSGGGYDANSQRAGFPGLNKYCGSRDFLNCEGLPLLSGCGGMWITATTAFTCK